MSYLLDNLISQEKQLLDDIEKLDIIISKSLDSYKKRLNTSNNGFILEQYIKNTIESYRLKKFLEEVKNLIYLNTN